MAERDVRHPLLELTVARLREFWRDPGALFWTFGFPVILAVVLGLAFRAAPTPKLKVALSCAGTCEHTAALLEQSRELEVERAERSTALTRLRQGKVDAVITVGPQADELEYHFDPRRQEGLTARLAAQLALARDGSHGAREKLVENTEPGARYIDFIMPALLGLNLLGSAIWGIGFSVVEARKRKLLKQLAATPMKKTHYLASIMLSRLVFLVVEVVVLLGFGVVVFGVPVRGSYAAIGCVSVLGSLAFTGIALWIAAAPKSTEVASGWANLAMLPMWLLSGVFFSYERFPPATHPFIRALPLTAMNDSLRAIINDGASLASQSTEVAVLLAWTVVSFAVALRTFRWQ